MHRSAPRIALFVLCMAAVSGCAHAPHKPRAEMATGDILSYGKDSFERKQYGGAIEFFKGYILREPSGEKTDQAHWYLGLCYFRTSEWPSAATEFQIIMNEFAGSTYVPDARYYLGLSCWKQSRPGPCDQDYTHRAVTEFERFLELYPDHPKVEEVRRARAEARNRLADKAYENGRIYLKLGHLVPARQYFQAVQ